MEPEYFSNPLVTIMSTNPPPLPEERSEHSEATIPFRFSMRTLLIGTTSFAVLCGLATALPYAFSQVLIGLIWIAVTGWLVTGLFYASSDQRAFCIGAVVVLSSMWTRIGGQFMQGTEDLIGDFFVPGLRAVNAWMQLGQILVLAAANGWLCIKARRYFIRDSGDE